MGILLCDSCLEYRSLEPNQPGANGRCDICLQEFQTPDNTNEDTDNGTSSIRQ